MTSGAPLGEARIPIRAVLDELAGDLTRAKTQVETAMSGLAQIGKTAAKGMAIAATAAIAAMAAIGTAAFKAGMEVDEAYDKITIGTGATGEELEGLKQSFSDVFTSIPTDAGLAADVIAALNARLGLTGDELEGLATPLLEVSRLLGGDATRNTELFTRAMGDWGVSAGDAAETLDMFFVATQSTGVELDGLMQKVVQFGAPLRLMGFDLAESTAMLSQFEAQGVNTELVMGSLRIAAGHFADAGLPLRESLLQTFEAIQSNEDATAALALGMEVFGARAGPDMVAAIREGRFAFEELLPALENAGGAIGRAAKATEDWPEKLQILKNKATMALAPIGLALMDVAGKVLELALPAFERLADWITNTLAPAIEPLIASISALAGGFGALAAGDLDGFLASVGSALLSAGEAFGVSQAQMQPFIDGVMEVAAAIGSFITNQLQPFVSTHAEDLKTAFAVLAGVLVALGIAGMIAGIAGALASLLNPITLVVAAVAALAVAWTRDWGGIRTTLTDVWTNDVLPILTLLKTWLETTIPPILAALAAVWTNMLLPAITAVWQFINASLIPLLQSLVNLFKVTLTVAITALAGLWQNVLAPAIGAVFDKMGQVAEQVTNVLAPKLQWLQDHVLGPLKGAFDGIGGAVSSVIGWIDNMAAKLAAIKLPDWLTPGSPTPFELGLLGIGRAMDQLNRYELPALRQQLVLLSADEANGTVGFGGTTNEIRVNVATGANPYEIANAIARRQWRFAM